MSYHEELEKRGGCGVVTRETRVKIGWLFSVRDNLSNLPLFKILVVEANLIIISIHISYNNMNYII